MWLEAQVAQRFLYVDWLRLRDWALDVIFFAVGLRHVLGEHVVEVGVIIYYFGLGLRVIDFALR